MNRMKKIVSAVVLSLILLCFVPFGNAKAATKAQISVKVPTEYSQVQPSDVIEVGVYIKLTDFTANNLQFYVNFDNTKLSVKRESGGVVGTLIYQELPDDDAYPNDYIADDWDAAIEGSAIKIIWANGNYTPDIAPGKEIHFMNLRFTVKDGVGDCSTSISVDKSDINVSYAISETQSTELKSSEIAVSSATINITNKVSTDATLKSLVTTDGTLSPAFGSSETEYKMTVPYTTTKVSFKATPNHAQASCTISGGDALKEGNNEVKVTVTAQDGQTTKTYRINVIRTPAATDNTLKSLKVNGTTVSGFSATKDAYTLSVPYETDKISITAEQNNEFATVNNSVVNEAISAGESKTFTITVTSQKGESKDYTVTVTRAKCSVNTLSDIKPSTGSLSPKFSSGTLNYTMQVPYSTKSLKFTATATHKTASVVYEGDGQEVDFGNGTEEVTKTVKIVVTAQDGTKNAYTVTVTRAAAEKDATLKSLTDSLNKIKFDKNKHDYSFTVEYTVSKITITGTANSGFATVSGNVKDKELNVGENKFEIKVTAQDKSTEIYTVTVTRTAPATDNTLSSLKTDKGEFDKTFNSSTTEYFMTVPYNVSKLTFTFEKANAFAGVNVQSPYTVNLAAGKTNDVNITVTAQNGDKKVYTVHVTRIAPITDSALKELSPSVGEFTEKFDPSVTEYRMTLNSKVKTVEFKYAVSDSSASVVFRGDKNLSIGDNEFTFTVTAQDGSKTVYKVIVTQVFISDDATLKSLKVKNAILNFDPKVKNYEVSVPVGTSVAEISFETTHELAKAELNGDVNLKTDAENVFNIVVTAQDGTVQTYVVTIKFRTIDSDSKLKELNDNLGKLKFDPDKTEYDIDVPYNTDKLTFQYVCESDFAVVQIDSPDKLVTGEVNVYTVTVTAEDGTQTIYTVNVTKNMMIDDAKLESIKPSWGTLMPDFSSENTEYKIVVPNSVTDMSFEYVLINELSDIKVKYPEALVEGDNVFTFTVTAQNGEYTVYTVVVTRNAISSDSSLSSIKINGNEIEDFSPSVFDYSAVVPNSVTEITLEYILSYMAANAEITLCPEELLQGDNLYVVTVTAEDGTTSQYSIVITRLDVDSDSTLSEITVNGNNVDFDPSKTEYTVEVENDVETAIIEFKTSSKYAKAVLSGSETLVAGVVSEYTVTVTADDGSVTEYKINVLRKVLSSDSSASEIVIGGIKIDVLAVGKEHRITLPYATDFAEVIVKANDPEAKTEITGNEKLNVGINVFTVKITAVDGTSTVYTINVERDAGSSDASLRDIIPSVGKLNESFGSGLFAYTMNVEKDVESINFDIKTSHELASYVISDTNLKTGTNRITITVTSENGAILTYVVDVVRAGDSVWYKLCNTTVFSIGNLNVSVLVFGIAALLIIIACTVTIVIVVNKGKVKRIKHR